MDPAIILPAILSGIAIGLILGMVGGGGSILAVPLLVHAVGVQSPHVAIGTAAVAVAVNAAIGLAGHLRAGDVKWRCGAVFAAAGVIGALIGAEVGKAFDGTRLLLLFGLLMVGVGASMLRKPPGIDRDDVLLNRDSAQYLLPRLVPAGLAVGLLAGFFGIGGGFLIVPAMILATSMSMRMAIGTSLVVVTALGLTTAGSYAWSGLVDWRLLGPLVIGGAVGSAVGIALGHRLASSKRLLERSFAVLVIVVGGYVSLKAGGLA